MSRAVATVKVASMALTIRSGHAGDMQVALPLMLAQIREHAEADPACFGVKPEAEKHFRQWLGPATDCSTEFVVSGAGAKVTDFRHEDNDTLFEDDQTEGFLWVEIVDNTLTAYFYDKNGNEAGPFVVEH